MTDKKLQFGKAIPILASLDIARSLRFFNELGFNTRHIEDYSYGIATRDDVEIHFWHCDDKHIAENTSCYIRVGDINTLHAEFMAKLPTLTDVTMTAWGIAEFYVFDPDGNLIKFGQPIGEEKATGELHY